MPTLKGKWCFKEVLDLASLETPFSYSTYIDDPNIVYGQPFFRSGGREYTAIYIYNTDSTNAVSYGTDEDFPYEPGYGWHGSNDIEFLYPIEIDEESYNWFIKNAVPLAIKGTWRFNKTLKMPVIDRPELEGLELITNCQGLCTSLHWSEASVTWIALTDYDGRGGDWRLEGFVDGRTEIFWTSESDWGAGEDCRVLTFHDNLTELDPDFALWFYENAHSMELKLYSECYIAEAVDTIRSITGTTKGYTVKDLSAGIEEVKQSAVSYTGSTWTFRDPMDWPSLSDYIHANGEATEYGACLHFDIDFTVTEGVEGEVYDNDDYVPCVAHKFEAMKFYSADGDEADAMYYIPSEGVVAGDMFTVGDAGVFEQGATIRLNEEPNAELLDFLNTFATKVNNSECKHQQKTVNPSSSTQIVTPDSGYDGLSSVTVNACSGTQYISSTNNYNVVGYRYAKVSDSDLVASNIKSGVSILGVTGTYSGSGSNTATVQITAAGVMFNEGEGFDVTYTTNGKSCQTYATVHRSLTFQADIGSTVTIHGLCDTLPSSSSFAWNWQGSGEDLTFTVVSSGGIMDISASS